MFSKHFGKYFLEIIKLKDLLAITVNYKMFCKISIETKLIEVFYCF